MVWTAGVGPMTSDYEAAMVAVGTFEPTADWTIDPASHARALPPEAGPLARVLSQPDLRRIISRFQTANSRAIHFQRQYKRFGRLAILLNAAAILIGSVALITSNGGPVQLSALAAPREAEIARWLTPALIGVQFMAILGALIAAQLVIRLRPFDKWMQARAEAELARIALFDEVVCAEVTSDEGELPALSLQLEYFRRYQLETQLAYYSERGHQHEHSATVLASRHDVLALVSAFATAPFALLTLSLADPNLASALKDWLDDQMILNTEAALAVSPSISRALFFAGIIASGLVSTLNALALLSQDRRNASRYLTTWRNLAYLSQEYLGRARQAASDGNRSAIVEFANAVNEQVSSEHQEWIALQEESVRPEFETIAASRMPILQDLPGL